MLATLPLYLIFLATALGLLAAGITIYVLITPQREISLIREGNQAAAYSLSGTAIGMALVLYGTASSTFSVVELAVWGAIGVVSQLLVLVIAAVMIPRLRKGLEENNIAYGIILGAFSIAMGILNAGSLSS